MPLARVGDVVLLATIRGLVSEAERVRAAIDEVAPKAIALAVSPEAVAGLLRYAPVPDEDPFDELPDADLAYSERLRAYGPVALPPPDLVEAVQQAQARALPLFGVDLPEEAYEDVFTKEVSAFALLWYGRVQRKLAKRPPRAPDARAFSLAWDARVRRVRSVARVERRREAHIAEAARALAAREGGPVLLVLDAPQEAGVTALLNASPALQQA